MKKVVIILSLVLCIALIGLGISGVFLYKFWDESKSKETTIKEKDDQIRVLKVDNRKDKKQIDSLKNSVAKKDKRIDKLEKQISKKSQEKTKADIVAENGEYMSEDSGGSPNDPQTFLHRSVEVKKATKNSITFHLWNITSHSADGGSIDDITVALKNGHGSFSADYQYDGVEGKFNGTIDIIDSKTIKIYCLDGDWGNSNTHLFTKDK